MQSFRKAGITILATFAVFSLAMARVRAMDVDPLPPLHVAMVADMPEIPELQDELSSFSPAATSVRSTECWTWQVLPQGLMYKSYLAGPKEPRIASQWVKDKTYGWIWDITLGGRVGILRKGTCDPLNPQGWQVDIEGAAFPRLNMEHENDLVACDYRFGIPFTHAVGRHHYKIAYYHLSSHLGDEWMLQHPGIQRINYSRDAVVFGYSFYPRPAFRLYGEVGCALGRGELTDLWEFQFGAEYSPPQPTGFHPVPFMAINGYLRQEFDYGGSVTVQSGLQWRGATGNLFRMGMQCYAGTSDQFEFYDQYECKVGFGIWYDF